MNWLFRLFCVLLYTFLLFFQFCEEHHWNFDRVCIHSVDDRFYQNLTAYSPSYVGHGFSFAWKLSDFSIDVLQPYWHGNFCRLVKLIPRYFMYYESIFRIALSFSPTLLCICLCACMCVCAHMQNLSVFLWLSPPYVLRQGLLLEPEDHHVGYTVWSANPWHVLPFSFAQHQGYRGCHSWSSQNLEFNNWTQIYLNILLFLDLSLYVYNNTWSKVNYFLFHFQR